MLFIQSLLFFAHRKFDRFLALYRAPNHFRGASRFSYQAASYTHIIRSSQLHYLRSTHPQCNPHTHAGPNHFFRFNLFAPASLVFFTVQRTLASTMPASSSSAVTTACSAGKERALILPLEPYSGAGTLVSKEGFKHPVSKFPWLQQSQLSELQVVEASFIKCRIFVCPVFTVSEVMCYVFSINI